MHAYVFPLGFHGKNKKIQPTYLLIYLLHRAISTRSDFHPTDLFGHTRLFGTLERQTYFIVFFLKVMAGVNSYGH